MRKYLYDAFSDRSLKEQEHLVAEVVDQFIEKIGNKGKDPAGIDIVMWFNLAAFDIIGSLAFGQTFGPEHFWVSVVVKSLGMGSLADCFKRFPMVASAFQKLFTSLLKNLTDDARKHEAYTMDLVQKKMSQKSDRKDFLTKILESRDTDNISVVQIATHASDFVIAGSETTAMALGSITCYLQKNPDICSKLHEEIRSSFQSYDEINNSSTATLPYLNAVILEGMRVYPPLPFALPRVVPPGGDTVDGLFLPGGTIVSTNPFAASMSSSNFKDPRTFNPERWLRNDDGDNLEACQSFSTSIRACLGRSLGWMELRTFLSKIHFKYDLDLLDPMLDWHRDSEIYTLWKKPVMKIVVRPRLDGTV